MVLFGVGLGVSSGTPQVMPKTATGYMSKSMVHFLVYFFHGVLFFCFLKLFYVGGRGTEYQKPPIHPMLRHPSVRESSYVS